MQQHPVPQHIASYEFRLIGDMTLKQFGMLAGSVVVALLFYASGLPSFMKWPAVFFFVILGVGLAFFPIEERPMHLWIIAFFKAIYSPTQFMWKKRPQKLEVFEATVLPKTSVGQSGAIPVQDQTQLSQYLESLPVQKTPLEIKEENFLNKVTEAFRQTSNIKPNFPSPARPVIVPKPAGDMLQVPRATTAPFTPSGSISPQSPISGSTISPPKTVFPSFKDRALPPIKKASLITSPPRKPGRPPLKKEPTVEAKTSFGLPIPQTPKTPNLLVGMVFDPEGKIIEGAILEIRNSRGLPVRALKTNKLGQFRIITPLENDLYEIETEKEGFRFDIIKLSLKGQTVPPIEIRSKSEEAKSESSGSAGLAIRPLAQ